MDDFLVTISFFLIIIYSIIMLIGEFKSWVYVIVLAIIAAWLLLYPQIVSPYIVGIDSHYERIIAESTLINGYWDPNIRENVVNAALSIAMVVPIFTEITAISTDLTMKIIMLIYPLMSIPIIWLLNKKLFSFSNKESFLSLMLLVGTSSYMLISVYCRQEIGLFVALILLYMLLVKEVSSSSSITIILLTIGLVFSHYSSAILFILLLSFSSLILKLLDKKEEMRFLMNSLVFLIFWLMYIVYATFAGITYSVRNILTSLLNWSTDHTSIVVQQQLNPTFKDVFFTINYFVNIIIILLLFFGAFYALYRQFSVEKSSTSLSYKKYILLALVYGTVILLSFLPGISEAYNPERIYIMTIILFNGFVIYGIKYLFTSLPSLLNINLKKHVPKINLGHMFIIFSSAFVLLHLLLQVGLPSELIYGNADSKYFGDSNHDIHYVLAEEVTAVNWLKEYKNENSTLFTDFYGRGRLPLQSYGNFSKSDFRNVLDRKSLNVKSSSNLFYQQKFELITANLLFAKDIEKIRKLNDYLEIGTNNIYNSGSTKVYYF